MTKTNYALITALYDTKGADLYNDVYFPIIKYEIVNQYHTQVEIEKYYDIEMLQNIIDHDFGIKIPLVVLKQSIRAIGKNRNGISLSIYENGKHFKIQKAWDISINQSIDSKSQEISSKFEDLEQQYKLFLETEGLVCKNTFVDFYSDNTEDILSYLEGNKSDVVVDEKYVNLAHFLHWIKENKTELYNIANDIFWGSIIAGFLKRNTADINIKPNNRVEYFLDSALVLAALDLDNTDNVKYANELLEIIKHAGCIPKVHSMTIREIKYILNSVEKEHGPRPNTAIEDAYYRRNLTSSKILQIKGNLSQLIEEKGIVIFPASESDLDDIENTYRCKQSVKLLEKYRGGNNNGIRDIHDVYLRDFIAKKRKDIVSIEKVNSYFVSLNSDLISYFNKEVQGRPFLLIHPAKIIIDLWIHSSHSSFMRKNGLVEIMSRCFALNNTDIRRKLQLVSKYYKESDENYSHEHYQAIYYALIYRSTEAINEVDRITENEGKDIENKEEINKKHIEALIKIAVREELEKKERNSDLSCKLKQLSEAKRKAESEAALSQKQAEKDIQFLKEQGDQDQENIKELQNELHQQKEHNRINESIIEISNNLNQLDKEKEKSICMAKFYFILFLECLFILGILTCLFILLYVICCTPANFGSYIFENVGLIITFCISSIGFVVRIIQHLYILTPKVKYDSIRTEQINYWLKYHPQYNTMKDKLNELEKEKKLRVSRQIE